MTIWGDGTTIRDFVYVEDAARAFVASSYYDGDAPAINIGSGQATTLLDAIRAVEDAFDTAIDVRFERGRSIDVHANSLAIELAREVLGWSPQTSLAEGVSLLAEELRR